MTPMKKLYLSKNERIGLFWASPHESFERAGLKLWIGLGRYRLRGHLCILPLPSKKVSS